MARPRLTRDPILPIGPSIAYLELTRGQFCLIDSCELMILGNFSWFSSRNPSTGDFYACQHQNRKIVHLHRMLMGFPEGLEVDHINGNTLDDRRINLRLADDSQSAQNQKISKNNTSGVKGVSYCRTKRKWSAKIGRLGKWVHLAYSDSFEEAVLIRTEAEIREHGKFRRT